MFIRTWDDRDVTAPLAAERHPRCVHAKDVILTEGVGDGCRIHG